MTGSAGFTRGASMRALTLHQPYASLIAVRMKPWETRGRRTSHRGPIAIHAGLVCRSGFADDLADELREEFGVDWAGSLPRGAVVAIGVLTDCVPAERVPEEERRWGDFAPGRFAWRIEEVRALHPVVPARGFQNLWRWQPPDETF